MQTFAVSAPESQTYPESGKLSRKTFKQPALKIFEVFGAAGALKKVYRMKSNRAPDIGMNRFCL
jgi:hypothetical protein